MLNEKNKIILKLLLHFILDYKHTKIGGKSTKISESLSLLSKLSIVVIFLFLMLYDFQIFQYGLVLLLYFKTKMKKTKNSHELSSRFN